MQWFNEPPFWSDEDGLLTVRTGENADFWRETHYGFTRDSGHLYGREVVGEFSATVIFSGEYEGLYDQAGLMLRLDERNWIKAGIEFTDGKQHLSAVVTRDYSDWSVLPLATDPGEVRLRISRYVSQATATGVRVEYALGEGAFQMLRLAYLPPSPTAIVGPMCCSPQRGGFIARFRSFEIGEPARELHA